MLVNGFYVTKCIPFLLSIPTSFADCVIYCGEKSSHSCYLDLQIQSSIVRLGAAALIQTLETGFTVSICEIHNIKNADENCGYCSPCEGSTNTCNFNEVSTTCRSNSSQFVRVNPRKRINKPVY